MTTKLPRLLRSGHLQSIAAASALFLWGTSPSKLEQWRVPISDVHTGEPLGHILTHCWLQPAPADAVLLVHGTGGSADSHFVVRAAHMIFEAGYHALRLDCRGAGASAAHSSGYYHGGLWQDLHAAVSYALGQACVKRLLVLGFSLGGHIALKMLGCLGDAVPPAVAGVVTVSTPLDISCAVRSLRRPWVLPYRMYIMLALNQSLRRLARAQPEILPRALLPRPPYFHDLETYNDAFIAPLHRFASARDYHERASAAPVLEQVRRQALLLHSADDPVVPLSDVTRFLDEVKNNRLELEVTEHGGHVGFVESGEHFGWAPGHGVYRALSFFETLRSPRPLSGREPVPTP